MTYIDILRELSTISSTNEKEAYLQKHKDVPNLMTFLKYMIDIRIKFWYTLFEPEHSCECNFGDDEAWGRFKALADRLSNREITGNDGLVMLDALFKTFTKEQSYWLSLCLKKDSASIGIGRKLVNKVWKNLVLDFKVSLAESEDEVDKFEFGEKASLELKLNGVRTIVVVRNGRVEDVYGRSGLPITNFKFIIPYIESIAKNKSFVLDGEVHVDNCLEDTMSLYGFDTQKDISDFTGKNGKVSSAWKKHEERLKTINEFKDKAKYSIFDYLEIDEWDNQLCKTKYQDRRDKLIDLLSDACPSDSYEECDTKLEMPPYHEVESYDEALEIIEPWIGEGLEGGILKVYNHLYSFKRDRNWIKIKEEVEEDVQIVDIFISKQKFNSDGTPKSDMMGEALVIDRFGRKYKIGTGKYLSEERRIDMWTNKDDYINGIYYVTAQRFTADAAICPRIEYRREDKTSLEN